MRSSLIRRSGSDSRSAANAAEPSCPNRNNKASKAIPAPAVLLWLVLAIALLVLWVFQPSLARPRREMDEVEEQP